VQLSYYFTQRFADESVDLKVREREKEGRGERERGGEMEEEKERSEGQERFTSYSHLPPPSLRPECFPFNAGQEHLRKKDVGLYFGSYSVFDTQVKAN
jgi:hypothetical protein